MKQFFAEGVFADGSTDDVKINVEDGAAERVYKNRGETRVLELAVDTGGQVAETYAHLLHSIH